MSHGRFRTEHDVAMYVAQGCLVGPDALKMGWPSLHIVKFTTRMKSAGVNLLGIVSKRASRILMPERAEVTPETTSLLNKVCFFRYAHSDVLSVRACLFLQLTCLRTETRSAACARVLRHSRRCM